MSYDYKILEVVRVVDGDTVDLLVDTGFYCTYGHRFRLFGVDTPERGQARWYEAGQFVRDWTAERAGRLRVRTYKSDSFGRWLADVYADDGSLGQALIDAGLGVEYVR